MLGGNANVFIVQRLNALVLRFENRTKMPSLNQTMCATIILSRIFSVSDDCSEIKMLETMVSYTAWNNVQAGENRPYQGAISFSNDIRP